MDLETGQAPNLGHVPQFASVGQNLSTVVGPGRPQRRANEVVLRRFDQAPSVATATKRASNRTPCIVTANAGEHGVIHSLLRAANQSPTQQEFVSWLDEPSYAPSDRLLWKDGDRIVAHVQVLHRAALFSDVRVTVGGTQDLAVLPEFAALGYDRLLVDAAEGAMRESHAIVSLIQTDRPTPYRSSGWSETDSRGFSRANVGDLLAHLTAAASPSHRRLGGLRIRFWRHVELDAVRAVYRMAAAERWGALARSEPYWQWLVGRRAHSDLIVAVDGADAWEDLGSESRIVGYAVTHGPHVLELFCLKEFARAAPRLLERACQDAIERDYHTLSLHTAPDDPLHELMLTAGGAWCTDERTAGGWLLVKLLDPERWIEAIDPILRERTKAAGIARPCELRFDVSGQRYQLVLTRRRSRLIADEAGAVDVRCTAQAFSNLLVGNLSVFAARDDGQLAVANEKSLKLLTALFPRSLFWQSPFDTLRM